MSYYISNDYLAHHGVKGMHWGVRRYQNADGSLKRAGQLRYGDGQKFRASNGLEVGPRKKGVYHKVVGKLATVDGLAEISPYATHASNRQVKKERQALREYNAHMKDMRKANRLDKKINKMQAKKKYDVDSFNAIKSDMKYSHGPRKGKTFYSVEDAKRDQKAVAAAYDKKLNKLQAKRDKAASNTRHLEKALRKNNMENAYDTLNDKYVTNRDRWIYSDRVTRKAAQIYADNANMTYYNAMKQAKKAAWTEAAISAMSSIAYDDITNNGPMSRSAKGFASKQAAKKDTRANTTEEKKLKKVAKNVYEWR